jgi:hypothetical protein
LTSTGWNARKPKTFDGISFATLLRDPKASLPERPIFITAQNGCSVHLGKWKLVRDYKAAAARAGGGVLGEGLDHPASRRGRAIPYRAESEF